MVYLWHMRKRSDEIYKKILAAANTLFIEKGYTATTIDEISAQANVTKRTLYSYFTDKKTLFLGVIEDAVGEPWELDTPLNIIASKGDLYVALYAIANGLNDIFGQPRYTQVLRVLVNEINTYPEFEELARRGITNIALNTLTDLLNLANKSEIINIPNPKDSARMFVGGLLTYLYLDGLLTIDPNKLARLSTLEIFRYVNNFLPILDCEASEKDWHTSKINNNTIEADK